MTITHDPDLRDAELETPHDPTVVVDVTDSAQMAPASEAPPPGTSSLDDAPRRPLLTITDAALACQVSRKTITRKLGDLAEHGAAKDDDGVWRIPVEALLAAGLHPGRSLPSGGSYAPARPAAAAAAAPSAPAPAVAAPEMVTIPRDRWDDLRIRLARAEAEASERALALADARLALRALTAGPSHPQSDPDEGRSPGAEHPVAWAAPEPGGAAVLSPDRPGPGLSAPQVAAPPSAEPVVPPTVAQGWQAIPPEAPSVGLSESLGMPDLGVAPPAPTPPPRKRRWWQAK